MKFNFSGVSILCLFPIGLISCVGDNYEQADSGAGADADTDSDIDTCTDTDTLTDTGTGSDTDTAPDGWSCKDHYYDDGYFCDCGCSVADWDCYGAGCTEPGCTDVNCDYCYDQYGDLISCEGDPPDDWSCSAFRYFDGYFCDCGCGTDDPDCEGGGCSEPECIDDTCDNCFDANENPIACTEAPEGWNCYDDFYGTGDGCDCGCGLPDPDCEGGGCAEPECYVEGCEFCYDANGEIMDECITDADAGVVDAGE